MVVDWMSWGLLIIPKPRELFISDFGLVPFIYCSLISEITEILPRHTRNIMLEVLHRIEKFFI